MRAGVAEAAESATTGNQAESGNVVGSGTVAVRNEEAANDWTAPAGGRPRQVEQAADSPPSRGHQCCNFKVPVPTDIFPKTNWRILLIIVRGFISMFVHHNLASNSIVKYGSIAKYCSISK